MPWAQQDRESIEERLAACTIGILCRVRATLAHSPANLTRYSNELIPLTHRCLGVPPGVTGVLDILRRTVRASRRELLSCVLASV
jgi:hypothetical protein